MCAVFSFRATITMVGILHLAGLDTAFLAEAPRQEPESGPGDLIEVEAMPSDEAIAERLRSIYAAVDDFDSVVIEVDSGVVTLTGEVAGEAIRREAVALARRTEGVVLARDWLSDPEEISDRLQPAWEKLREMGRTALVKAPLALAALLVILAAWMVARLVERRQGWLGRLKLSLLGRQLLLRVVKLAVLLVGAIVALELLDATAIVGAVVGAAGLAGLALGFAFKSIVENYLAGVLLSTRNPFEIGDVVEIEGKVGKVARLTARDTVLITLDGNHLRIPNAMMINSVLLNLTRNPRRRFEFDVGISTDFDLTRARRIGVEVLASIPAVLDQPEPMGIIQSLGDSSVMMRFFAWVDQDESSFLRVRSEGIRLVKEAFDSAGIEMPEPIYRVHLREGLPSSGGGESEESGSAGEESVSEGSEGEDGPPGPPGEVGVRVEEDLSADDTIDRQIAEEKSVSREKNFLEPKRGSHP